MTKRSEQELARHNLLLKAELEKKNRHIAILENKVEGLERHCAKRREHETDHRRSLADVRTGFVMEE